MSLVNLPLPLPLAELVKKHADALGKKDDGIFALSNPNRQRWGFFDVVAISPHSLKEAEAVMARGLAAVWGKEKAEEFMKAIYHAHPQFVPGKCSFMFLNFWVAGVYLWGGLVRVFLYFSLLYFSPSGCCGGDVITVYNKIKHIY